MTDPPHVKCISDIKTHPISHGQPYVWLRRQKMLLYHQAKSTYLKSPLYMTISVEPINKSLNRLRFRMAFHENKIFFLHYFDD